MKLPNNWGGFVDRHIGPRDITSMLESIGVDSLEDLISKTIPEAIRLSKPLDLDPALNEAEAIANARAVASKNQLWKSYIGCGYYDTALPAVIGRNILENPGWYTQYTPYQAEISQGRLEALLNFQTVVSELTAMEIANASLLDEATAAAEAMLFCLRVNSKQKTNRVFQIVDNVHPQTIDVIRQRAEPLKITIQVCGQDDILNDEQAFAVLLQYPGSDGAVIDYAGLVEQAKAQQKMVVVASDLLALTLLCPPGEWGADVVVGSAQRFGVPLGFGGPHAAFFATREEFKREIPGRIVGVSKDADGNPGLRLALQTREQHIRREKATSNICTAQALLAILASMYAVYHGPKGLEAIARRVNNLASRLASSLTKAGLVLKHRHFFDTIRVTALESSRRDSILSAANSSKINLRQYPNSDLGVSLDEATTGADVCKLMEIFAGAEGQEASGTIPSGLKRESEFLAHPVFNSCHSESEMMRYIHRLQARDLSLTTSMIPLGSCTMKLNAASEMLPVSWPEFANLHPFAPQEQCAGYLQLFSELEAMLAEITALPAVSLQPNAGAQGEYAGLIAIRAYHQSQGSSARNVCLIPASAHGTNPASAVLAGMEVVVVGCDESGNVDLDDLAEKANSFSSTLSCLMITYPSTHGVFESSIVKITQIVHAAGGLVYMDGANLNAQVGLCRPGEFGVDVCHINLHKTFCIPHGGGGPGVGPIAAAEFLRPFLPGHHVLKDGSKVVGPISAAPWGSAGILPISWMYIKMMGAAGLKRASEIAILNANYLASRLEPHYPILYRGQEGFVAHECILDLRHFKKSIGVDVTDVAKRLMDYGFHAPTVSFPVAETLMVEPTESESKEELDRFCEAMISIRQEIKEIEDGKVDATNNVLKNAPHTWQLLTKEPWPFPYSKQQAVCPASWLRAHKYWPPVRRIDSAWGDRNLFCSCSALAE